MKRRRLLSIEAQIAAGRLRDCDRRLAEIELELLRVGPGSYKHQELQTEQRDLSAMRRVALDRITNDRDPPVVEINARRERDKRLLASEIRTRTLHILEFVEVLEREGDYYNGRLHRMEILNLPELICREFGLDTALISEVSE